MKSSNCEIDAIQQRVYSETKKVKQLHSKIRNLKKKLSWSEFTIRKLTSKKNLEITDLITAESIFFGCKNLKQKPSIFHYLYGSPVAKFDVLLECFLH